MKSNCIKLKYIHNDTKYILHLNPSIILSDKYAICLKFSEFERNKIIEDYATQNLNYYCIYKISVVCRIDLKHKKPLTKYQLYKKLVNTKDENTLSKVYKKYIEVNHSCYNHMPLIIMLYKKNFKLDTSIILMIFDKSMISLVYEQ